MAQGDRPAYDDMVLVYQGGLANLFGVGPNGSLMRVCQGDYRTAESIVWGATLAGAVYSVYHCDVAGDVLNHIVEWQPGKGELYGTRKNPPATGRRVDKPMQWVIATG